MGIKRNVHASGDRALAHRHTRHARHLPTVGVRDGVIGEDDGESVDEDDDHG
jgi:hypothetical protein